MTDSKAKSKEVARHPLAIAWDEWLATPDGEKCAIADTLPRDTNVYIKNRLWCAFDAGAKAAQSQLAKEVLSVARAFCVGNKVEQNEITKRLRDLFSRMGIEVKE